MSQRSTPPTQVLSKTSQQSVESDHSNDSVEEPSVKTSNKEETQKNISMDKNKEMDIDEKEEIGSVICKTQWYLGQIVLLLKQILHTKKKDSQSAVFTFSGRGIQIASEKHKSMIARAYVHRDLFTTFKLAGDIEFSVDLVVFIECLQIFGDNSSLDLRYNQNDSKLKLILSDITNKSSTQITLKTLEYEPLIDFNFEKENILNKITFHSSYLRDTFSELDVLCKDENTVWIKIIKDPKYDEQLNNELNNQNKNNNLINVPINIKNISDTNETSDILEYVKKHKNKKSKINGPSFIIGSDCDGIKFESLIPINGEIVVSCEFVNTNCFRYRMSLLRNAIKGVKSKKPPQYTFIRSNENGLLMIRHSWKSANSSLLWVEFMVLPNV